MSESHRKYDVVVYGATGYTGRLCAEWLKTHPTKPKWAIAGRDKTRLQALRDKLSLPKSVGTIEANNNDYDSLISMLKQTRSIVNVVGPFRQMGAEQVVKACTEVGTHYFDLSGETAFNATVQKYDEAAKSAGIILVPSVGLDSLPFDLSTYLAVQDLKEKQGEQAGMVQISIVFKGGLSGGTILSAMDMIDTDSNQVKATRSDWLSLMKGAYKPIESWKPFYAPPHNKYAFRSPLSFHNTRIVNQTHGLLEKSNSPDKYGPNFYYRDGFAAGNAVISYIAAFMLQINLLFLLYVSPLRWLIRAIMPRNYGPSVKNDIWKSGFMDLVTQAFSVDGSKSSLSRIYAQGQPGYSTTAAMIVEIALLTVQEPNELHPLAKKGGVITGALVGPTRLSQRLVENAQWTIETQKYDGKSQLKRIKKAK